MATAVACVADELPCIHYTLLTLGGAIRVAPYATFGTDELAASVVEALQGRTAALMGGHGAVTYGADVAAAMAATAAARVGLRRLRARVRVRRPPACSTSTSAARSRRRSPATARPAPRPRRRRLRLARARLAPRPRAHRTVARAAAPRPAPAPRAGAFACLLPRGSPARTRQRPAHHRARPGRPDRDDPQTVAARPAPAPTRRCGARAAARAARVTARRGHGGRGPAASRRRSSTA